MSGRVWKFDHDISTDVLSPGQYALDPVEVRKLHVLESAGDAQTAPSDTGHREPHAFQAGIFQSFTALKSTTRKRKIAGMPAAM